MELSFDFIQATKHEKTKKQHIPGLEKLAFQEYQCHPFGDEFYAEKQS